MGNKKSSLGNVLKSIFAVLFGLIYLLVLPFAFFVGIMTTDSPQSTIFPFLIFLAIPMAGVYISFSVYFGSMRARFLLLPIITAAIFLGIIEVVSDYKHQQDESAFWADPSVFRCTKYYGLRLNKDNTLDLVKGPGNHYLVGEIKNKVLFVEYNYDETTSLVQKGIDSNRCMNEDKKLVNDLVMHVVNK